MEEITDPDEQTTEQAAWEERPGCLLYYATRVLARLVLVAPPAIMGAQVGMWGASHVGGDLSYALAIAGVVTGGTLGLGLALRGVRGRPGTATRADLALCLLALVFLARVVMGWFVALEFQDIGPAYLAALAGAAIVSSKRSVKGGPIGPTTPFAIIRGWAGSVMSKARRSFVLNPPI